MNAPDTDQILVSRAQSGDKRSFERLVERYQPRLSRLLSRLIRDPAELQDVTQEAFIRAYRALAGFRGDSAFYTWLYRIGINTARNHLASAGRRIPSMADRPVTDDETGEDTGVPQDLETPESTLLSREMVETVNAAMESLPRELRSAIQLRELEGLSYEEIAGVMNCPVGTVRSRIFRAREAIAARLKPLLDVGEGRRW
jgi:RNA polymerase sigma-70 factor (ECF subfamily)